MARIPRTATVAISALTALVWLVTFALNLDSQAAAGMGFIPARLGGAVPPWPTVPIILTPLTATLVHSGLLHLALNLVIFLWCGNAVERVLGKGSLIILYVIGAYAAALAQWFSDPSGVVPMVGASGAISAIIGAFALSFGRAKQFTRSLRLNRWINTVWLLLAWIVLQLMMRFLAGSQRYLLATPAHVGGFLAGLILQRPLLFWRYRSA